MHIPDDPVLVQVIDQMHSTSQTPFLVGGAVRDLLLNRKSMDYDFLVSGGSLSEFEQLMTDIAEHLQLNVIRPSGFKEVIRLVNRTQTLDFTFVTPDRITENLLQRDFTCNAIAMDMRTGELLDPSNGAMHIQQKVLKAPSPGVFADDPVRVLRMFRFQSQLGFSPEADTLDRARAAAPGLTQCPGERVREEFFKILSDDTAMTAIHDMADPVLLSMFPSLAAIKGLPQNGYHHLNVLDHTLAVMDGTFNVSGLLGMIGCPHVELTEEDRIVLRMAALFHDVGKAPTWARNDKGFTTFKKHQYVSANLFQRDMEWLKPSNRIVERTYMLIRRHMLFLNFALNGYSQKSFRKLINMMRTDSPLLALLAVADKLSARGPLASESMQQIVPIVREFITTYQSDGENIIELPKLVSGHEVMEMMKLDPSPAVGDILGRIMERQLEDSHFSREDALNMLKSMKNKSTRERK